MAAAAHIADFFALYPDFNYNPVAPVSSEFIRLMNHCGWERNRSPEYKEAWNQFGTAMGRQFASYYGSDVHDINAWQALCIELKVDAVPDTIIKCKRILRSTHVNLVDFIDVRTTGQPVRIFRKVWKLRQYTRRTEKYYPRGAAKESGVLASLLRKIL